MANSKDPDDDASVQVTAKDFRRDPEAVYQRARREGAVTILDAKGRPSMTVVVPLAEESLAAE